MTFGIGARAVLHPLDPLTFDRHRGGHFSLRTIVQRRGRWNTTRPVNNGNRFMKKLAGSAYTQALANEPLPLFSFDAHLANNFRRRAAGSEILRKILHVANRPVRMRSYAARDIGAPSGCAREQALLGSARAQSRASRGEAQARQALLSKTGMRTSACGPRSRRSLRAHARDPRAARPRWRG